LSNFRVINVPTHTDSRGVLSVIDDLLPFPMKRVYWIHSADGAVRGGHRHRSTRQALIALRGRVTIHMDDGSHVEDIHLESPDRCLLVEPEHWHTMEFGPGSVLLVFASRPYDKNEYIDEPYQR